jgi:hypothetical protein
VNWARIFFGMLIVIVGTLLLLDNAGVLDAGEVIGTWWPVILIGGGLLGYVNNPRHRIMPLIVGGGGAALLLRTTGVIDTLSVVFPILVILVGLVVAFGWGSRKTGAGVTGDSIRSFNLFSGSELASHSDAFTGGTVGAVFGGAEIDLRDTQLAPGATLDVFTAFGGIDLTVPPGWRVDVNGIPIFGGIENITTKEALAPDAPTLRIDATVLFGALEIKH